MDIDIDMDTGMVLAMGMENGSGMAMVTKTAMAMAPDPGTLEITRLITVVTVAQGTRLATAQKTKSAAESRVLRRQLVVQALPALLQAVPPQV